MNNNLPAVILNTSHSPYARLKPVSIKNVHIEDGFWQSRVEKNQNVTLPTQYHLLESTGRLDNFLRASGNLSRPFQGYVFNDSDVYKWLEAASWTLAYNHSDELGRSISYVIKLIADAQDKNGYLNTYFSVDRKTERWSNLLEKHELYCAGHLIQAAIAHHRITGESSLLYVAIRLADHIYNVFGPGRREGTCGHPEIEMALIELFRTVGEPKYLELAQLFINRRGNGFLEGKEYLLDHKPFRNLERLTGHAVRALYLCSGATDLYLETGEGQLLETLENLWNIMARKQMYITGGVGSRHDGEAIGAPYELPNARAYAETCAAIANMMWNWRMLQMTGNARYADLLEWALYNAILPGISLDGSNYFYVNPLQDDGSHQRHAWFECACCPPNISRTLAALPGYIYSFSAEGIWMNLYAESHLSFKMANGKLLGIHQVTSYPWEGQVTVEITQGFSNATDDGFFIQDNQFSIFLRIPDWVDGYDYLIKINHEPYHTNVPSGSYLEIRREWQVGDILEIEFPMETRYLEAHPSVLENNGRVAITRGPLVYCLESVDNPDLPLSQVVVDPSEQPILLKSSMQGVEMIQLQLNGRMNLIKTNWENNLYRRFAENSPGRNYTNIDLIAIPYFAWANRKPGTMQMWVINRRNLPSLV